MIRTALISLASALASPAAAAGITLLDDLDPLTRGICEQLAINAQCPLPDESAYVPKVPPVEKITRPCPRPDWCLTDHAWRFPRCTTITSLEIIYGSVPATGIVFYGHGRKARGSASALAWSGAFAGAVVVGGVDRSGDHRVSHRDGDRVKSIFEVHHHYAGCCEPSGTPLPPVAPPAPIPLPGAAWLLMAGLAGFGFLRGVRR